MVVTRIWVFPGSPTRRGRAARRSDRERQRKGDAAAEILVAVDGDLGQVLGGWHSAARELAEEVRGQVHGGGRRAGQRVDQPGAAVDEHVPGQVLGAGQLDRDRGAVGGGGPPVHAGG